MKVYNTQTRMKEPLETRIPGEVRIYTCGPTVYSFIHIGNARAAVVFDTLRRYLISQELKVHYVSNFTDIDDKVIVAANLEGISTRALADRYIAEYETDAHGLNIMPPDASPRATESIPTMIALIERLIERGHAYVIDDGVYFAVRSWPEYGKLSNYALEELQNDVRDGLTHQDGKRDPLDFVLWKAKKEGEPAWPSPWGEGRPGWHIECSAMVHEYLDDIIDIHAGGLDLIFPHHENEIAQSEAATGAPFARYWMHNGFVKIDHVKMSKSAGNFRTVRQIAEHYDYRVMRYLLISSHYRSPMNFSEELLEAAETSLGRIDTAIDRLRFLLKPSEMDLQELPMTVDALPRAATPDVAEEIASHITLFHAAMDDDLNTADALSQIFELVRFTNRELDPATQEKDGGVAEIQPADQYAALAAILYMGSVLGLTFERDDAIPARITALVEARAEAKAKRDFGEADRIRDLLTQAGYLVKDTPQGPQLERIDG